MNDASRDFLPHATAQTPEREAENAVIAEALRIIEGRFKAGVQLVSPRDVAEYLRLRLAPAEHEVFAVLFLDC